MDKSFQNKLEFYLFKKTSAFFCKIGLLKSRTFAKKLAWFFFHIIPIRKEITFKNLRIAFPDKTDHEIRSIAFNTYINFATTLIEILCIPSLTKEDIIKNVSMPNLDLIKEVYSRGNGLLLMTAHFGNWELAALSVGLQLDIPLSVITKNQRNGLVNEWLNHNRRRFNNRTVPLGASIRQIYIELKEKRIVALVGDQRGPSDGLRVKFFGRDSAVYPGPAAMALKMNAPLLFGMMLRNQDGTYVFRMEEVSKDNLPSDPEEQIKELSQRHTALLEHYATRYPDHWLWMHNRWKY